VFTAPLDRHPQAFFPPQALGLPVIHAPPVGASIGVGAQVSPTGMTLRVITQPRPQVRIRIRRCLSRWGPSERAAWQLHDLAHLALGQAKSGDQLVRGSPLRPGAHHFPLANAKRLKELEAGWRTRH